MALRRGDLTCGYLGEVICALRTCSCTSSHDKPAGAAKAAGRAALTASQLLNLSTTSTGLKSHTISPQCTTHRLWGADLLFK